MNKKANIFFLVSVVLIFLLSNGYLGYRLVNYYRVVNDPHRYDNCVKSADLTNENETLLPVQCKMKTGYINTEGKVVINMKWDHALMFNETNLAIVKISDKWGLIDKHGIEKVQLEYKGITYMGYNKYLFEDKNKSYLATYKENKFTLLELPPYSYCGDYSENENLAYCYRENGIDYIDLNGTIVSSFNNVNGNRAFPSEYYKDFAIIHHDDKYKVINRNGEFVTEFDEIYKRNNRLHFENFEAIPYKEQGKWGLFKYDGTLLTEPIFKDIKGFGNSHLAPFTKDDVNWGYIDDTGKIIIEPQYSSASMFDNGYAAISNQNKKFGLIDTQGQVIIPFEYDYVRVIASKFIMYVKDSKTYTLDINTKELINIINNKDIIYQEVNEMGFSVIDKEVKPWLEYGSYYLFLPNKGILSTDFYVEHWGWVGETNGTKYYKVEIHDENKHMIYKTVIDENGNILWKPYNN